MNVKYLSVLFVGDDAFDADQGHVGMGQYLFAMVGNGGDHAMELDSGSGSGHNQLPRSHPAFYSVTLVGGGPTQAGPGELMHINDGTGGSFVNMLLVNPSSDGVYFQDCSSSVTYTQVRLITSASNPECASDGFLHLNTRARQPRQPAAAAHASPASRGAHGLPCPS